MEWHDECIVVVSPFRRHYKKTECRFKTCRVFPVSDLFAEKKPGGVYRTGQGGSGAFFVSPCVHRRGVHPSLRLVSDGVCHVPLKFGLHHLVIETIGSTPNCSAEILDPCHP